jgi:hypothetical protein
MQYQYRKKCNSKFRNNAVLASYKQPNPCAQVLFNFLHHPTHMEKLPSSARKTPQKPYFFRSRENQFGSQILCK